MQRHSYWVQFMKCFRYMVKLITSILTFRWLNELLCRYSYMKKYRQWLSEGTILPSDVVDSIAKSERQRCVKNGLRFGRISYVVNQVSMIKNLASRRIVRDYHDMKICWAWLNSGQHSSPPHAMKEILVRRYAARNAAQVFVETGTYMGDMVFAVKDEFEELYTVELSEELFVIAEKRFEGISQIHVVHGDSSKVLKRIVSNVNKPTLFWLDGHYSGGNTAGDSLSTPIIAELDIVLQNHIEGNVVLLDDARLFVGANGYPKIEDLIAKVRREYPECAVAVECDVLCIELTPCKG